MLIYLLFVLNILLTIKFSLSIIYELFFSDLFNNCKSICIKLLSSIKEIKSITYTNCRLHGTFKREPDKNQ